MANELEADPALAAALLPGARVIEQQRGVPDIAPLSRITTQTIASLKRVGQERDACLGVSGTPVEPGVVAVGDPVALGA